MSDARRPDSSSAAAPDWDALARRAAGECTPDEEAAIDAWLAAHPEDAELLAALASGVANVAESDASRPVDVEAALARVHRRMDETRPVTPLPSRRAVDPSRQRLHSGPRWAIGGLAAAAAAAIVFFYGRRAPETSPTSATASSTLAAGTARETAVGVRDSVRLADGTRVVLAPGSRLVVAPDYGRRGRDVTLVGAAWFSVKHDAALPFTVHAGRAIVRDLGTEFAVRTDGAAAGGVSVVVTGGSVALRAEVAGAPADSVVLIAGDRGELDATGRVVLERGASTDADVAWTSGRLVYRDAPLADVSADLRRWYGVELVVSDPVLAGRRYSGDIREGEPVDSVLRVISLAVGGEVSREGRRAVLRAPGTVR